MSLEKFPNFFLNLSESNLTGEVKHSYQFKSFRLNVGERQLLNNGISVPLTPKAFDVLVALVESSGHLVEKDELLRNVWADSFVEEINVARIVHTLRKALGEDGNGNKFIETVAKKGYRFVAEVTEICEPTELQTVDGNRNSADLVAAFAENEPAIPPAEINKTSVPLLSDPKKSPRFVLLTIGILGGILLISLLSFSFQAGRVGNPNKAKSIAVLPVKSINSANRDEIYEIGIADSLINRLSLAKGFSIRPLSATYRYRDIEQDPIAAGKEQKADYVLASNYQLAGGRIRVTSQLSNVASGQIEDTYTSEADAANLFMMQDAIAGMLAGKLMARFAVASSRPPGKRGTDHEEAYRLYLQGKNWRATGSGANAKKAIEYFEQAIRIDPQYALAYAGMGSAYIMSGNLGGGLPREEFEKARFAINKALELDPNLGEAYLARASLKFRYEWDFAGAEEDHRRAGELETILDVLSFDFSATQLTYLGRFDEAMAQVEAALENDPTSLRLHSFRAQYLYFARRYDEAIAQYKRVAEVDEDAVNPGILMMAYEMKGDDEQAYHWFMKQKRGNPERREIYQKAYETGGWKEVRRKLLEFEKAEELTPAGNAFRVARQAALLGEKETAFEYLYKAFEKRHSQMVMLKTEPAFDAIRDDRRFDDLINRIGFN